MNKADKWYKKNKYVKTRTQVTENGEIVKDITEYVEKGYYGELDRSHLYDNLDRTVYVGNLLSNKISMDELVTIQEKVRELGWIE